MCDIDEMQKILRHIFYKIFINKGSELKIMILNYIEQITEDTLQNKIIKKENIEQLAVMYKTNKIRFYKEKKKYVKEFSSKFQIKINKLFDDYSDEKKDILILEFFNMNIKIELKEAVEELFSKDDKCDRYEQVLKYKYMIYPK